jgi:phospholipid-binding lipoprotein MlaA
LGPSNPRDAVGLAADGALLIYPYFVPFPGLSIGVSAIGVINARARYLDEIERAREAALDFYVFVRNAYVQRRWREIHGEAPAPDEGLYDEEVLEGYLEEGD